MKDKIEQAKRVVKSVTDFNKLPFPTRTMDELQLQIEAKDNEPGRQYMFYDLLRTPTLRKHSLILFYLWLVVCSLKIIKPRFYLLPISLIDGSFVDSVSFIDCLTQAKG